MEKSTSPATQVQEPPPFAATSPFPAQVPPIPTAAGQRSAELPSPAIDLDSSPAAQPHLAAQVPAPAPPSSDPSSRGRKRALEANLLIENSNYYKMRLILKDLRPHVLEVLRIPDVSNSKAATEIQEKMKLMLQLYQEMIGELPKREKTAKSESLSNGKANNETPHPPPPPPPTTTTTTGLKSAETSYVQTDQHNSGGDGHKVGDTVVGGSAFGWNFVTHGGTQPVYCGMSKEEYRSSHPIIQVEADVELHNTL